MSAKFSIKAKPTFQYPVHIPIAGSDDSEELVFTFKHRKKTELMEFMESREGIEDIDSVMEMVVGWNAEEEFNRENVLELLENYGGAALAILKVYGDQLLKARSKN